MCHSHTEVQSSCLESLNKDAVIGLQGTKASESLAQACPPPPEQWNFAKTVLCVRKRSDAERDGAQCVPGFSW